MPTQTECPLTITWLRRPENLRPRAYLGYSIDTQYLTSTDEFEITFYDSDPARLRWLQLEPVELSLHGELVLVGRIERIERGQSGSAITVRGRDYFADLVQGEIDPTVKISEDQTFRDVIKYCGGPHGITRSIDLTGKGKEKLKPGERKPEPGQGVYDFLNRIAARLGCTLQPGLSRDLVNISVPNYTQSPSARLFRSIDPVVSRSNNVDDASCSEDYTRVPTHALSSGKVAKTGESPSTVSTNYNLHDVLGGISTDLLNALSEKVDGERRLPKVPAGDPLKLYRLLYVKDDDARTADQVERAVVRATSERLKDTLEYNPKVVTHFIPGTKQLWSVDLVAEVTDDPCDIDEPLWVAGVRFSYRHGQGSDTQLTMWRLGALQL